MPKKIYEFNIKNVLLPGKFSDDDKRKSIWAIQEMIKKDNRVANDYCLVDGIKDGHVILKFYNKEKVDGMAKDLGISFFQVIKQIYLSEKKDKKHG